MIQAIETKYKGYRFRSRLEARWAVFLDTLGIKYQYEKEGYDLGCFGCYLPDFWLSEIGAWLEIKAEQPNKDEVSKARALWNCQGSPVFIMYGDVWPDECKLLIICSLSPTDDVSVPGNWLWLDMERVGMFRASIPEGYEAARSARFEHGEMPLIGSGDAP